MSSLGYAASVHDLLAQKTPIDFASKSDSISFTKATLLFKFLQVTVNFIASVQEGGRFILDCHGPLQCCTKWGKNELWPWESSSVSTQAR